MKAPVDRQSRRYIFSRERSNSNTFPCAPDFQYHQGSHEALPLQYHHDHLVSADFSSNCSSGCSSHGASPISNRAHELYGNLAPPPSKP
ncbi:hypothetical protein TB2_033782 [Malus domestica]